MKSTSKSFKRSTQTIIWPAYNQTTDVRKLCKKLGICVSCFVNRVPELGLLSKPTALKWFLRSSSKCFLSSKVQVMKYLIGHMKLPPYIVKKIIIKCDKDNKCEKNIPKPSININSQKIWYNFSAWSYLVSNSKKKYFLNKN